MSLIPYAGYDPHEKKRVFNQPARALMMFNNGKDTLDIARHFGVSEATAHRWVTTERSDLLGLPNPCAA